MKLFEYKESYTKSDGIIVTKYSPTVPVFISSINLENGSVSDELITEYSKHENIKMYRIHDDQKRFKDFWVSNNHSLIVYNQINKKYEKIEPQTILNNIKIYSLVKKTLEDKIMIPCFEIQISLDLSKNIGYDFTVTNNFTFCNDDGIFLQDTMAIYVPITKEAIAEARDKMISSESKDSLDGLSDDFSKDIIIGIYVLTQDSLSKKTPVVLKSDVELDKLHPLEIIRYDGEVTTVGRVLFNKILPSKKYYTNKPITKSDVKSLAQQIYKDYGHSDKQKYIEFVNKVVNLGMKYYTLMGVSFTLDDLMEVPKEALLLKEQLRKVKSNEEADKIIKQIISVYKEYAEKKNNNIGTIGKAGGLKQGFNQATQVVVTKGLIQSGTDVNILVDSYSDGFNTQEYFKSGYGSRQGIIDRVLNTSETGYLSRQLVYALQRVEADPAVRDCKTKRYMKIKVTPDIARRLNGRNIVANDGKIIPFDKKYVGKVIALRSPLYCISKNICLTCYGNLLLRNRSRYVGIMAGEVCGESLTQTIMRTFHLGGSVSIKTINITDDITRTMSDADKYLFMKSFKQEGSKLIALEDGEIEINLSEYEDPRKDIIQSPEILELNYAYFNLKYLSYNVNITIDNKIGIALTDKVFNEHEGIISIKFKKGSVVFDALPTPQIFSEKVKILSAVLSGRTPWRNSDHFFMKIFDIYSDLSSADMIHYEILASNLLRDSKNPSYPARLNKNYDPIVKPLKSVPGLESWLQALAFEDPKQSITNGLIYDRPPSETILEKIITGNF